MASNKIDFDLEKAEPEPKMKQVLSTCFTSIMPALIVIIIDALLLFMVLSIYRSPHPCSSNHTMLDVNSTGIICDNTNVSAVRYGRVWIPLPFSYTVDAIMNSTAFAPGGGVSEV